MLFSLTLGRPIFLFMQKVYLVLVKYYGGFSAVAKDAVTPPNEKASRQKKLPD